MTDDSNEEFNSFVDNINNNSASDSDDEDEREIANDKFIIIHDRDDENAIQNIQNIEAEYSKQKTPVVKNKNNLGELILENINQGENIPRKIHSSLLISHSMNQHAGLNIFTDRISTNGKNILLEIFN